MFQAFSAGYRRQIEISKSGVDLIEDILLCSDRLAEQVSYPLQDFLPIPLQFLYIALGCLALLAPQFIHTVHSTQANDLRNFVVALSTAGIDEVKDLATAQDKGPFRPEGEERF